MRAHRLARSSPSAHLTVIARDELSGDELIGAVNSRERAADLRAMIAAAIPDAELIDHTIRSIDDAIANHEPGPPSTPASTDDPAVRETLAAYIADQERDWLDEPIPALGGRTPRDAATDPVGRKQLSHLLDAFSVPDDSEVAVMNPQRLRAALGL